MSRGYDSVKAGAATAVEVGRFVSWTMCVVDGKVDVVTVVALFVAGPDDVIAAGRHLADVGALVGVVDVLVVAGLHALPDEAVTADRVIAHVGAGVGVVGVAVVALLAGIDRGIAADGLQ